jgi:hypothetical protein
MMISKTLRAAVMVAIVLSVSSAAATETPEATAEPTGTPVISADTIAQLAPVVQIDFDGLGANAEPFNTGWFAMSDDGRYLTVVNAIGQVILLDDSGMVIGMHGRSGYYFAGAAFDEAGEHVYTLFHDGFNAAIFQHTLAHELVSGVTFAFDGQPLDLWVDDDGVPWAEVLVDGMMQVMRIVLDTETVGLDLLPYGPDGDPDAVVRIGRIPPPYVVTSSEAGDVKVWDMTLGEVIREAEVDDGPAVFGQINADATTLIWRDPASLVLRLLDLETGEDRLVTALDGEYVQYFLVTPAADVILGVQSGEREEVFAWDAATGARYELGPYRACGRVPDMARLSVDGATLVIGCDTGIEIWRITTDA